MAANGCSFDGCVAYPARRRAHIRRIAVLATLPCCYGRAQKEPAHDDICWQIDLPDASLEFVEQVHPGRHFSVIGLARDSYVARGIVQQLPGRVAGGLWFHPAAFFPLIPIGLSARLNLEPDRTIRADLAEAEVAAHETISVVQQRDIVQGKRAFLLPLKAV